MNKAVLGIDLGTSSVKVMLKYQNGDIVKNKATYEEISPSGWINAIKKAISGFDASQICAIGLSSQVGTYIIDDEKVISWNDKIGKEELEFIKNTYSQKEFVKEISMPHPDIISYPIPRLMYIKEHFRDTKTIYQPKDYIYRVLTGEFVSDQYSWRGLANLENGRYSQKILNEFGINDYRLPNIVNFKEYRGLTHNCEFLPDGIPVYVGLNDYYASLLGMGIINIGDMFDITGTSEHLGVIEDKVNIDTKLVSGPYIYNNVHYGVTASSGASLDFGLELCEEVDIDESLKKNPPVFLPYLNGERAPIWDSNAKGVFYGITGITDKADLAYSVFEGVVFSLYHIYEHMGKPDAKSIKVSGGAAGSRILNRLKAEMFGIPIITMEENDTSALGACIVAATGEKWYPDMEETIDAFSKVREITKTKGDLKEILFNRYELYKKIYPAIKDLK